MTITKLQVVRATEGDAGARKLILATLEGCEGSKRAAAAELEISEATLYRAIDELKLHSAIDKLAKANGWRARAGRARGPLVAGIVLPLLFLVGCAADTGEAPELGANVVGPDGRMSADGSSTLGMAGSGSMPAVNMGMAGTAPAPAANGTAGVAEGSDADPSAPGGSQADPPAPAVAGSSGAAGAPSSGGDLAGSPASTGTAGSVAGNGGAGASAAGAAGASGSVDWMICNYNDAQSGCGKTRGQAACEHVVNIDGESGAPLAACVPDAQHPCLQPSPFGKCATVSQFRCLGTDAQGKRLVLTVIRQSIVDHAEIVGVNFWCDPDMSAQPTYPDVTGPLCATALAANKTYCEEAP